MATNAASEGSSSRIDDKNNEAMQRAAARGTLWSFLFKILSFVCTQLTFRLVKDPSVLGMAHVELELVWTTILFLSREGFRLTLTKRFDLSLARLCVWVHTVVAFAAFVICFLLKSSPLDWDWCGALALYCAAAWVEGFAEPRIIWCLANMRVAVKASAEGLATVAKTFSTVLLLVTLGTRYPVSSFGAAQLIYAISYNAIVFSMQSQQPNTNIVATREERSKSLWLILGFTVQGVFKHALTEGDRIVLLAVSGHYDQGLYAIGSSYGGMAARLLLQPLEENARLLWSRSPHNKRSYTLLVRLVVCVGLLFACVAVHYTDVLMVLLGQTRAAAPVVAAFCVYTAFLAWNGTTEALVYAVASSGRDIGALSLAHTVVGVSFALMAPLAVHRDGTVGLVLANAVCMAMRALYAVHFASQHFSTPTITILAQMTPNPWVWMGYGLSFWATRVSRQHYNQSLLANGVLIRNPQWWRLALQHVGVGVGCVIGIGTLLCVTERRFLNELRTMFLAHKNKQE